MVRTADSADSVCVFIHIDAIRGGFERSVESCRRVEDSELYIVEKRLGVPVFRPASGRHEKRQTAVRRLRGEGLKNWCLSPVLSVAPSARCCFFLVFLTTVDLPYTLYYVSTPRNACLRRTPWRRRRYE
jgi:hypothetical protein